jgi:hypothetical protein
MPRFAYARTDSFRVKEGRGSDAVALLRKLSEIMKLTVRIYVPETGKRDVIVMYMESEKLEDLVNRDRNADPAAASSWATEWHGVVVEGSHDSQIWQVR